MNAARTLFLMFGGAVAWLLHLVFAYVIAEFGVLSGLAGVAWAGIDAVSWLLLGWSLAMLALAAAATAAAWRSPAGDAGAAEPERAARFCVRFARAGNTLFLAIIAVQTLPVFFFLRTP